jgi:uncharacterized OsmC-like protein
MTTQDIAAAIKRVESVLHKRPQAGLQDDAPATSRWEGNTRVLSRHPSGLHVVTDMPTELGGTGDQVTPGWLLRAAQASCATTCIVMAAATQGIALRSLEVVACSRSDARGLLGIADIGGTPVPAGPTAVELRVSICAPGVSDARLQALVKESGLCSPVSCAMESPVPVTLHIDVLAA